MTPVRALLSGGHRVFMGHHGYEVELKTGETFNLMDGYPFYHDDLGEVWRRIESGDSSGLSYEKSNYSRAEVVLSTTHLDLAESTEWVFNHGGQVVKSRGHYVVSKNGKSHAFSNGTALVRWVNGLAKRRHSSVV